MIIKDKRHCDRINSVFSQYEESRLHFVIKIHVEIQ